MRVVFIDSTLIFVKATFGAQAYLSLSSEKVYSYLPFFLHIPPPQCVLGPQHSFTLAQGSPGVLHKPPLAPWCVAMTIRRRKTANILIFIFFYLLWLMIFLKQHLIPINSMALSLIINKGNLKTS